MLYVNSDALAARQDCSKMKTQNTMKKNRTLGHLMLTKQNKNEKSKIKVLGRAEALESKSTITQSFSE